MDNHWRIRQSVVEQVPKLSRLFGMEMFQSKLEALKTFYYVLSYHVVLCYITSYHVTLHDIVFDHMR